MRDTEIIRDYHSALPFFGKGARAVFHIRCLRFAISQCAVRLILCWISINACHGQLATVGEQAFAPESQIQTIELTDPSVEAVKVPEQNLVPGSLTVQTKVVCKELTKICFSDCDEVWRICARSSEACCAEDVVPEAYRLINGCWVSQSVRRLQELHATDEERRTVMYIHGNRTDEKWSISRASQLYQNLLLAGEARVPVRFVIWQWTAETEVPNPVKDFQVKSERSIRAGQTLQRVLAGFREQPLVLMGYSLGAQLITSGLVCQSNSDFSNPNPLIDLVFIAPVFDESYARQIGNSNIVATCVRSTSIFLNVKDPVLKIVANPKRSRSYTRNVHCIVERAPGLFGCITEFAIGNEVDNKHAIVEYTTSQTLRIQLLSLAVGN